MSNKYAEEIDELNKYLIHCLKTSGLAFVDLVEFNRLKQQILIKQMMED